MPLKPFERRSSRIVLETPIFKVREDLAAHPVTGREGTYVVLENPDWVNMVALDDAGKVILVRQWRHGTREHELELPAGMVDAGESPEACAARELAEETGYVASSLRLLGGAHPNAAYQHNTCFTVLAEGCRRTVDTSFDDDEDIEVVLVHPAELKSLVRSGVLRSGMVIAALLRWLDDGGRLAWP